VFVDLDRPRGTRPHGVRTRTAETVEFVLSEKRPADRAGHPQIGEARRYLCCMTQAVPTYSKHVAKG
jgi:hypothetical protein